MPTNWLKTRARTRRGALGVAIGLIAALGAVGGAAALDVITKVSQDPSYRVRNVSFLTSGGAPVEVLGAPRGDAQAVANALELPGWYQPKDFLAVGSDAATRDTARFVLVFGAANNVDGKDACRGAALPDVRDGFVLAAFCNGDDALAEAVLSSDALVDPASDGFRSSMRGLFSRMLPRRNPEREGCLIISRC